MNFLPARLTLRQYFETSLAAECAAELKPNTLKEIRTALKHWERETADPVIQDTNGEHVRILRDALLARQLSPATVKKVWAHLSTLFRAAIADEMITGIPQAGRLRKSILPKSLRQQRQQQRPPVKPAELERLFYACDAATYPRRPDTPTAWRVLLYLFWTYGPRTLDAFSLTRQDFDFPNRLIRFRAMKTSKLQALPLTDFGVQLFQQFSADKPARLFPGFSKPGCWNRPAAGTPHWIPGFYTTWNAEISPAAGVIPSNGPESLIAAVQLRPDAAPPIRLKTFRQTMVTELNDYSKHVHSCRQLGAWVAGHYLPGVTAQNYDFPESDIIEAVTLRESQRLPECFRTLLQ